MTLDEINDTPILFVLAKLGIATKRESNAEYVLQRNTGEFANGRKANINKNIVGDFSHGEAGGKVFGFVMDYLRISKEDTFSWFDDRFGEGVTKVEKKPRVVPSKTIMEVRSGLPQISKECQELLESRFVSYEKVKDIVKGSSGGIGCLLYKEGKPIGCNIRTLSEDHTKRFIAIKDYGTEGIYKHEIDETKDYVIVVEGLIDFLTLRQFDTNVVGLKSNKSGLDEIRHLAKKYKIYLVPDNDLAGLEVSKDLGLIDYYLFDLSLLEGDVTLKDINDLAIHYGGADTLCDMILEGSKHIEKGIENSEDNILVSIEGDINDTLNLTRPLPFTFGLPSLDAVWGKFDYGQLHAILGESGSGKTTFTFFQAIQNSKKNKVLYVSLEMPPDKLISLRARKLAGITAEQWSDKTFSELQVVMMKNQIDQIQKNENLKVVGGKLDELVSIDKVLQSLDRYIKSGYRLIYIDNLGYIEGSGGNATEKINDVIRKFQKYKQANGCTIALLHHFNKGDKKSRNDRGFQDVMNTAKLEHDIDYGVFVTRDMDNWDELTDEEKALTNIEIKKDRENGIMRKVQIYFKGGGYTETYEGPKTSKKEQQEDDNF